MMEFAKTWKIPAALLAVMFALMLGSSLGDSLTTDEDAHIPAGYSYVRFLDYRLNPEHPPLLKALSALPLLLLDNLSFPTRDAGWTDKVNDQWDLGTKFLYETGNDARVIVQIARIAPILITLLSIFLLYWWGRELLGPIWGLVPAILFGLSPTVLSHGHYVTTDLAAAFGVLIALYTFVWFLNKQTAASCLVAGLAFGIAELMKFSAILLIPLLFFIAIAAAIAKAAREKRQWMRESFRAIVGTVLVMLVGLVVIYIVYFLFTVNYPIEKNVSDVQYIFAGAPGWITAPVVYLVQHPILRPLGQYALGVGMVVGRASGGNTGYFLGTVTNTGWWNYFPVVFVTKETLPALALIALGTLFGIRGTIRALAARGKKRTRTLADYLGVNLAEFSMLSFVILYWAYSMKSPLNIGVRHLLPTLPLLYLLATSAVKRWVEERAAQHGNTTKALKTGMVSILLTVHVAESALVAPFFISYFNELGGGTEQGHAIATDSNYDWGQDLWRLASFVEKKGIQRIAVDYFGGGSPTTELGTKAIRWHSALGNPKTEGIEWLAVSVNALHGSFGMAINGFEKKEEDEYRWLGELRGTAHGSSAIPEPDFKVGTSLFIYHL